MLNRLSLPRLLWTCSRSEAAIAVAGARGGGGRGGASALVCHDGYRGHRWKLLTLPTTASKKSKTFFSPKRVRVRAKKPTGISPSREKVKRDLAALTKGSMPGSPISEDESREKA